MLQRMPRGGERGRRPLRKSRARSQSLWPSDGLTALQLRAIRDSHRPIGAGEKVDALRCAQVTAEGVRDCMEGGTV